MRKCSDGERGEGWNMLTTVELMKCDIHEICLKRRNLSLRRKRQMMGYENY